MALCGATWLGAFSVELVKAGQTTFFSVATGVELRQWRELVAGID
jgi:hypothetical protein